MAAILLDLNALAPVATLYASADACQRAARVADTLADGLGRSICAPLVLAPGATVALHAAALALALAAVLWAASSLDPRERRERRRSRALARRRLGRR
jgi:hypothetical protein